MNLSVIIPCKKEAATISSCIQRVSSSCPGAEIIVVDSGLDDTKYIVDQLKTNIPHLLYILSQPDRGKGDAIRQGIESSTRGIIAQIDADLQFYPEELPKLIQPLLEDRADMTLGSRFTKGSVRKTGSSSLSRSLGNFVISLMSSLFFNQKISDALAGMKAWKREVTASFRVSSYSYSYEIELFTQALLNNWRVLDVPVTFEARKHGQSTVPVLKTGFTLIKDIISFRFFPTK